MKLFIDTNILLEIYHLSGPDLDELKKLITLVKQEQVELLLPKQVVDEFWRNRESTIADALKKFRETKAQSQIPNIIRTYPAAADLKAAIDMVNSLVKQLTDNANQDVTNSALKPDVLLKELLDCAPVDAISDEILLSARIRVDLGNPPGKKGSLGDAVNWEWLLHHPLSEQDTEVVLLSADGDYESELIKRRPKEFLVKEWSRAHPCCKLTLEKSLPEFLQREFPQINLADSAAKLSAIQKLESSLNFAATHSAIAKLDAFGDFFDAEARRILDAYLNNKQIRWIVTDPDVEAFAHKIVGFAKAAETKAVAAEVEALLKGAHESEAEVKV